MINTLILPVRNQFSHSVALPAIHQRIARRTHGMCTVIPLPVTGTNIPPSSFSHSFAILTFASPVNTFLFLLQFDAHSALLSLLFCHTLAQYGQQGRWAGICPGPGGRRDNARERAQVREGPGS